LLHLFENKSKRSEFNIDEIAAIDIFKIQESLENLKKLIDNKAQPMDIMMLVHGKLHPELQIAYGLKLKQQ